MWNDMLVSPSASPWERTGFVLASFALFIIVPAMDKREGMCMYMCVCLYVGCTCGGMQRSASSGVCEAGLLTGLFGKSGWPASTGNPVSASKCVPTFVSWPGIQKGGTAGSSGSIATFLLFQGQMLGRHFPCHMLCP